jgi:hypothetical protein
VLLSSGHCGVVFWTLWCSLLDTVVLSSGHCGVCPSLTLWYLKTACMMENQ